MFCVKIIISVRSTQFMRKRKNTDPDPYIWQNGSVSGSGRPKKMLTRIRFWIRIPNTAKNLNIFWLLWFKMRTGEHRDGVGVRITTRTWVTVTTSRTPLSTTLSALTRWSPRRWPRPSAGSTSTPAPSSSRSKILFYNVMARFYKYRYHTTGTVALGSRDWNRIPRYVSGRLETL